MKTKKTIAREPAKIDKRLRSLTRVSKKGWMEAQDLKRKKKKKESERWTDRENGKSYRSGSTTS